MIKKKFTTDSIVIYIDKETVPYDYIIYFKIEKISGKTEYKLSYSLPKEIIVKESNLI